MNAGLQQYVVGRICHRQLGFHKIHRLAVQQHCYICVAIGTVRATRTAAVQDCTCDVVRAPYQMQKLPYSLSSILIQHSVCWSVHGSPSNLSIEILNSQLLMASFPKGVLHRHRIIQRMVLRQLVLHVEFIP